MNQTVAAFQKNRFEEIRVGIKEFKGYDLIDIRVWTDVKGQDEKVPTAKGLSLNIEFFPELKKAILQLEDVLKKNNMLAEEKS